MNEYILNDTEQVRIDAINLVDHLTEYGDSGNDDRANELFRDFVHHLVVNGFIKAYSINNYNSDLYGLSDDKLYTIHPALFTYFLIKYCFAGVPEINDHIDLDFPDWEFTMEVLMKYLM